ncbi:hypothetical protein Droror1_Dr00017792 [Drosera rotundifolia]
MAAGGVRCEGGRGEAVYQARKVPLNSYGFVFNGLVIVVLTRGSFMVRMDKMVMVKTESREGDCEGERGESVGVVDDGVVVADKKLWKPKVKLGDVMGVMFGSLD